MHHRDSTGQPSQQDWTHISARLEELQVPAGLRSELRSKLSGSCLGLLLYGSWARGDADERSDLDVLALDFTGPRPSRGGRVSLSLYEEAELQAASGTLFGHHLVRDGLVLFDPEDRLANVLALIKPPVPGQVLARVQEFSAVLDVPDSDRDEYLEGLTKVARYLLRSALYAKALAQGAACFSVREIAAREADPDLATVLSSHRSVQPAATAAVLRELCRRLEDVAGPLQDNPYGDLHSLIECAWQDDRDLSNFATLILGDEDDDLPYSDLPKVLL